MKKFAWIVRVMLQAFTRRAVWMGLLILIPLATIFLYFFTYINPFFAVMQSSLGQIILTLVFMFMGIELRREQRREHLDDLFATYYANAALFRWGQVLTLGLLAGLTTLVVMAGFFVRMQIAAAHPLWVQLTLKNIVLLYFLPCWVMGVWGLLIAQWHKGKTVYLPALLVWLLTSTFVADIITYTTDMGFGNAGFLINTINLGIISYHVPGNFVLGAPVELPRWVMRVGILTLLAALLLADTAKAVASTRRQKRRQRAVMAAVAACSIATLAFFGLRYGVFFTRFADPKDVRDYVWNKSMQYIPGKPVSLTEDFPTEKKITLVKTDIDLSCSTQGIRAVVEIQATLDTLTDNQSFTLYSDLVVDEIRVDGQRAEFQRSHDGLLVRFSTSKQAGEKVSFTFYYHGYSLPNYPANETTVQLNRAFPWIPWPGIKTMGVEYIPSDTQEHPETFFIEDWQRADPVYYTLCYRGPGNIYTNLDTQGDNRYHGNSDTGVSLYSGMAHERYRDVDIYIPASQSKFIYDAVDALLDAQEPLLDLCQRMGARRLPQKPRSIALFQMVCPMPNYLVLPQEPYSWGAEWEIRQPNDGSATIANRRWEGTAEEYRNSPEVRKMVVSYLVNPCTGYPIDIPKNSTSAYTAWLSMYLLAGDSDKNAMQEYREQLLNACSWIKTSIIEGQVSENSLLTQQDNERIDSILTRMRTGENFDESFKALYQRLLQREVVAPMDIVTRLYEHKGD